jgi:capsular polysaccharide biosynthesis protein
MATRTDQNTLVDVAEDGAYVLSLGHLFRTLWKRLWVIVLVTLVLIAIAIALVMLQTPRYEATLKILVGQERGISETPEGVAGLQQLTRTIAEAVASDTVAEVVIEQEALRITPEDFQKNLTVRQIPNTQFIEVNYRDPDPTKAQRIANAVGEVSSKQISDVSSSANAITATVWERARISRDPVSPNLVLYVLLALMLGTALGVALAFLLEYRDDSWGSPEEAERITGAPVLAVIPGFEISRDKKISRDKRK